MMKTLCVMMVLLGAAVVVAEGQVRKWTMPDGKAMTGEIRSATTDTVELVRKSDGRTFTLPLAALRSEADRRAVVAFLEKKTQAGEETVRRSGLKTGPYAAKVTGQWEKMESREGRPFYFFAGTELKEGELYPLVVYLHDKDSRGAALKAVEPALEAFVEAESYGKRPCFVVAPQCPAGRTWTGELGKVSALVGHVMGNLPVDLDRVYVVGNGLGASGAGQLAAKGAGKYGGVLKVGEDDEKDADWLFGQRRKKR